MHVEDVKKIVSKMLHNRCDCIVSKSDSSGTVLFTRRRKVARFVQSNTLAFKIMYERLCSPLSFPSFPPAPNVIESYPFNVS